MKTLLSRIGFEGFFLLIRIITIINSIIIVVIKNLVKRSQKKNLKIKLNKWKIDKNRKKVVI